MVGGGVRGHLQESVLSTCVYILKQVSSTRQKWHDSILELTDQQSPSISQDQRPSHPREVVPGTSVSPGGRNPLLVML